MLLKSFQRGQKIRAMETHAFLNKICVDFLNSFQFTERAGKLDAPIKDFSENMNETTAKEVYNAFLYCFRLSGLEEILTAMQKFETTSSKLLPSHRDHYIHTVNVFLLGIALYAQNEKIRHAINASLQYTDKYKRDEEEFVYRWGMTALFHDVGYPLEIAYKSIREFTTMLIQPNLICSDGDVCSGIIRKNPKKQIAVLKFPDIGALLYINSLSPHKKFEDEYFKKYPELIVLQNDLVVLISDNISKKLGFATTDIIYKRIRELMESSLEDGLLDHGIYSSIVFLKWINDAFLKAKWNPAYYYYSIADAATAIFLHNSYDYLFRVPPFNWPPLHIEKQGLTFLLILCDRIQESDRVSYGYSKKGINFLSSSIDINDRHLILRLYISPDEDENLAKLYVNDMKEAISKSLDVNSVFESVNIEVIKNKEDI